MTANLSSVIVIGQGEKYVRLSIRSIQNEIDSAMFFEGSTAPASYIPYGYEVPMVVRSENLFDKNSESVIGYIDDNGSINTASAMPIHTYAYIAVSGSFVSYKAFSKGDKTFTTIRVAFYDASKNFISRSVRQNDAMTGRTVILPNGCVFVRLSIDDNLDDVMLTPGSTAPTSYIPYSHTDTPIYIGDTPLAEDEYVDYGEQKVYRMEGGVLTPTDPPAPIPALPTVEGTTVYDADLVTKPSEMEAEADARWLPYTPKQYDNGAWRSI